MKKILSFLFFVIPINSFCQTHSGIYVTIDSLIKNVLKYDSQIKNVSRHDFFYTDLSKKIRQNEQNNSLRWVRPIIYFNNRKIHVDELECITNSEIDSIKIINKEEAQSLFGSSAANGIINIYGKLEIDHYLLEINNKSITFTAFDVEISIDKSIQNKYFWKELIQSDSYFCDNVIQNWENRKRRIKIFNCNTINNSNFESCYEFEMIISPSYDCTEEEQKKIHHWQYISIPPPSPKFKIKLDYSRSYFYKILKYSNFEI